MSGHLGEESARGRDGLGHLREERARCRDGLGHLGEERSLAAVELDALLDEALELFGRVAARLRQVRLQVALANHE